MPIEFEVAFSCGIWWLLFLLILLPLYVMLLCICIFLSHKNYTHVKQSNVCYVSLLRSHPFMTSTRRGKGGQAQVDTCGRGRGQAPCGRTHRKLKLESADVILSSSCAKKLASFLPEFLLWTEKNWKFFWDIN